jgi:hypothetical protein
MQTEAFFVANSTLKYCLLPSKAGASSGNRDSGGPRVVRDLPLSFEASSWNFGWERLLLLLLNINTDTIFGQAQKSILLSRFGNSISACQPVFWDIVSELAGCCLLIQYLDIFCRTTVACTAGFPCPKFVVFLLTRGSRPIILIWLSATASRSYAIPVAHDNNTSLRYRLVCACEEQ